MGDGEFDAFIQLLFADQDLESMALRLCGDEPGPPFDAFCRADDFVADGDTGAAITALLPLTRHAGLESRVTLWAWSALRELGYQPSSDIADEVLGVVLEAPISGAPGGTLDVLAAYDDGTARYVNHAGSVVVWDTPDADSFPFTASVIEATIGALEMFSPPADRRRELATAIRATALTPAGCRRADGGEGADPDSAAAVDALVAAAIPLLEFLAEQSLAGRGV